ncbi:hypothetical protein [Rheinheimera sp. 4Y26]|uniref:hypothetical protein n=1 Tax=Rheinheimera sp. 4Y26 TaxID=2977811 RepID=UPI0021B0BD50|nr:hypothetical protein [Rheinheimera sp. 4Y26]MCT6700796.1 hypothetical protein [Rheinheimera sp. 4Y26]
MKTSNFVKQVHLETARRYQQQGYGIEALVEHFQKVALDENDIAELLSQMQYTDSDSHRQD